MNPTRRVPGIKERIKALPLIRGWRHRRHVAKFLSKDGFTSYYGVFGGFAEARQFLPPSKEFNDEALARMFVDQRLHRVFSYDYPVLFWLGEAFRSGAKRIFDIGGSVGVHYHAYRRYMAYPESLEWEVCETEAVVRLGRELAAQANAAALRFTDSLDPASLRADVWISAGAIQYLENGRPNLLLGACPHPPGHLLLNKLPLYDGEDFVSAQNILEGAFAPLYVYNRTQFIADIEASGYGLVDSWEVPEREFWLPDQPQRSFRHFSGLYFRKR